MDPQKLTESLRWLTTGGAAAAILVLASLWGEKWQWYKSLGPDAQRWLMVGLACGVGVAAWALLKWVPGDVWVMLQEPYSIVVMTILAFTTGQAANRWLNKPRI